MAVEKSIIAGRARVQLYSERLARIECSPEGRFRDLPSCVVQNRTPAGAQARVDREAGVTTLRTERLSISFEASDPRAFRESLTVEWAGPRGPCRWRFGDRGEANLGGTLKSLDGVGAGRLPELGDGLLSRSGYFVLDDSESPSFDPEAGRLLPQHEQDYTDIYFAVYDSYGTALAIFAELTGRVPMIPRWALGLWFSRYYAHSAADYRRIVRAFEKLGTPLEAIALDMDWHKHGWEGFDWNTDLIPDPDRLIDWLQKRGLAVGLNIHPGGLPNEDSHASGVRAALGLARAEPIRFNLADRAQAHAAMELLHAPLLEQGIDFFWVDGEAAEMPGLDGQLWTNHVYYSFAKRFPLTPTLSRQGRGSSEDALSHQGRGSAEPPAEGRGSSEHTSEGKGSGKRPVILSRYGGPGSQRYPVGFSGDAASDWAALAYEVRFTSAAGNALMPYWSHDIGGFTANHLDSQLYIRWVQFGAVSPALRLHSDHGDRAPWEYGREAIAAFKSAYELRLSLAPYLYSLCREAYERALPLARPMYLEWPDDEGCYRRPGQYMLGGALLACPITCPTSRPNAHVEVYLPPGIWYDYHTGIRLDGGRVLTRSVPVERVPLFARAGAIVPCREPGGRASEACPDPLVVRIFAGADGDLVFYEDDGLTQAWEDGEFAITRMALRCGAQDILFELAPTESGFAGWKPERTLEVRLCGVETLRRALVNGIEREWEHLPETCEVRVRAEIDLRSGLRFAFEGVGLAPVEDQSAAPLEVSAALLPAGPQAAPRLRVSVVGGDWEAPTAPEFSVRPPDGWSVGPVQDYCPNYYIAELDIPTHQPIGHHEVIASARCAAGDETKHAECRMDWPYASVTDFMVMGLFENAGNRGMEIAYGPETDFGYHPAHQGRSWVRLKEHAISGDIMPVRYIDLVRHFGQASGVVAYALTYLHSEYPREVRLDFGADDGIVAWLNSREILRAPEPGPAAPAQFRIRGTLRAGWNQVMLKIGQVFGEWGFYLEVRTPDGQPASGVLASCDWGP